MAIYVGRDQTEEEKNIPAETFSGLKDVARKLKQLGSQLELLTSSEYYTIWPGLKESKKIARLVKVFGYSWTRSTPEIYDHDELKARRKRNRAEMRRLRREHGISVADDDKSDDSGSSDEDILISS